MEEIACKNCTYSSPVHIKQTTSMGLMLGEKTITESEFDAFECRLLPPKEAEYSYHSNKFPIVLPDTWCGKFNPKPK